MGIVLAQNKPNTIALRPIQTDTDSVYVINSSKDLYYIKVKTNTGAILGAVNLAMSPTTGNLSLTIGGATYIANLGTQNDFESATYSSATGEITLTANDGTNTVLTIDGSETKLTGGAGISLTGNGTSATPYNMEALDISPTNELQTLGLSGQVLSISGANSLTLPNTSPVLVASNDLMITGGNLQTGAPLVQNTETVQNGFTRSFTGGNFGLGTNTPQNTLEVNSTITDSSGLRFTQVNKYTPKSTGENAYLAVNSLGNIVVGEEVKACPDTIVDYNLHKFIGAKTNAQTVSGWDFRNFVIDPLTNSLRIVFSDNVTAVVYNFGASTISDLMAKINDSWLDFVANTGNTTTLNFVLSEDFGYIEILGAQQNNLQFNLLDTNSEIWYIGGAFDPESDGDGAQPQNMQIGLGVEECEVIDMTEKQFDIDTDKVFYFSGTNGATLSLTGDYMGWSLPLGVQWNIPFVSGESYSESGLEIETDGLPVNNFSNAPQTYTTLQEYVDYVNSQASLYGSSFRISLQGAGYIFMTDLAGNPLPDGDPYIIANNFANFSLILEGATIGWIFKGYNPKPMPLVSHPYQYPSYSSMHYGAIPNLSSQAQRLNARAYAAPDSALFWNGDSLYLDNFANVVTSLQGGTFNTVGTSTPSQNVADDVYHTGKVAIGNTTTGIAKLRVGSNNFLAANTPKASQWISDNGGRLYIGDNGAADGVTAHNISIGEFGGTDTDVLQLHGKLGVNITGNNNTYGPDVVNVRVATNGNVGIGNTNPLNKLHIGSAFVPNTGGIRLPITSASPIQTGQAIGVDANGDIVVVAASVGGGGITSLGGQTGAVQTLSVTNTTAAQGWTSATDNHSLNLRAWDLNGNAGTNQSSNFVGTTDAQDLSFRTNNSERMRIFQNGGIGIGVPSANVPHTNLQAAILSLTTPSFTRVLTTITGATGQAEYYAGNGNTERVGFGYSKAGTAAPYAGIATAYSYITTNVPLNIGNLSGTPIAHFNTISGNTGLGELNPTVKLDVNGGLATEVKTVTVSGPLTVTDHVVLVNNGGTAFTATLPDAASFVGRHIIIKRINNTSTGAITINTAGGQVQALAGTLGATTSLAAIGTYGQAAHFISNGINWYRIN